MLFTIFRLAGTSKERFASEAEWLTAELLVLKALLEATNPEASDGDVV